MRSTPKYPVHPVQHAIRPVNNNVDKIVHTVNGCDDRVTHMPKLREKTEHPARLSFSKHLG